MWRGVPLVELLDHIDTSEGRWCCGLGKRWSGVKLPLLVKSEKGDGAELELLGVAPSPKDVVEVEYRPEVTGDKRFLPPTWTNSSCSQGAFGSILDAECSTPP